MKGTKRLVSVLEVDMRPQWGWCKGLLQQTRIGKVPLIKAPGKVPLAYAPSRTPAWPQKLDRDSFPTSNIILKFTWKWLLQKSNRRVSVFENFQASLIFIRGFFFRRGKWGNFCIIVNIFAYTNPNRSGFGAINNPDRFQQVFDTYILYPRRLWKNFHGSHFDGPSFENVCFWWL